MLTLFDMVMNVENGALVVVEGLGGTAKGNGKPNQAKGNREKRRRWDMDGSVVPFLRMEWC